MTHPLYRDDAYARQAPGRVLALEAGAVTLDRTIFYPQGGGQPGDSGRLVWQGGTAEVLATHKGEGEAILLTLAPGAEAPPVGTEVRQELDWPRRHAHMRMHTALHLLSAAVARPVSGGSIGAGKGRLDFDMEAPPEDREALEGALRDMVAADLPVSTEWITEEALGARPDLVKTMSVAPPRGAGRVRLVRIGQVADAVDLQPCGGTHVARTAEIGQLRLGKIKKKSARNRRITLHLL